MSDHRVAGGRDIAQIPLRERTCPVAVGSVVSCQVLWVKYVFEKDEEKLRRKGLTCPSGEKKVNSGREFPNWVQNPKTNQRPSCSCGESIL